MEIKEAIQHAREVSNGCDGGSDCAYQHDKLADWLEELIIMRQENKALKKALYQNSNPCKSCINGKRSLTEKPFCQCENIDDWKFDIESFI